MNTGSYWCATINDLLSNTEQKHEYLLETTAVNGYSAGMNSSV